MENILVNTNESQWVWNSLPQTYERAHLEPLVSEQKSSFPVRETSSSHSEKRGCVTGRESEKEGAAGQTGFPEIQTHLQRHRGTVESMVTVLLGNVSFPLISLSNLPTPHTQCLIEPLVIWLISFHVTLCVTILHLTPSLSNNCAHNRLGILFFSYCSFHWNSIFSCIF